jgi:hypothetical protein
MNDVFVTSSTSATTVDVPYTHAAWRGRVRKSAGVAALAADGVAEFDAVLARVLADRFPQDSLTVPHRVFAVVADAP